MSWMTKIKHAPEALRVRRLRALASRRARRLGRQVAKHAPAPSAAAAAPVVLFNASTRLYGISLNAAFEQLAGWSLRLAGVPVVHFVCHAGMIHCPLGTQRDDPSVMPPCGPCIGQSRALYTGADARWFSAQPPVENAEAREAALRERVDGLGVDALMGVTYEDLPLGQLALPALRWVLRRHHLEDDAATRAFYRDYILSAWRVAQWFGRLLDDVQPQAVLMFNGMFYPEATARWVAQRRGIRVVTHEVGFAPNTAYFTDGEATAYPIDIPASFELDEAQERKLDGYLAQRFQGNFSMAGIRFWKEMKGLSPELEETIARSKQVVPVFTNVIFDTSQPHSNVVFEHMFAWLDLVLDIARSHPETLFVIRAHPDEARVWKESRESVAGWVARSGADRLPNVVFVDATEPLSSYELIARSKFVMIYNSTIGLEASLMGAAVLCGGKARFTQYPTVFFPATPAAYREKAEAFLAADHIDVPAEHRRQARRFLYYQLYRTSLPLGDLIEEDGIWKGFVRFRALDWRALRPENHPALRVIVDGFIKHTPFLIDL